MPGTAIRTTSRQDLTSIIGNDQGFNAKISSVYNTIASLLGYPREVTYVRKYLVKDDFKMSDFPSLDGVHTFKETSTFLNEPQTELNEVKKDLNHISYVKKRESSSGHKTFSYIVRILNSSVEERMELRRNLNEDDYNQRKSALKDNLRHDLVKLVTVFVYKNDIFNLETYKTPDRKFRMLKVMAHCKDDQELIPPFVPVTEEITCNLN